MLPEQIKNYREIITLRDGANVLLRPMTAEDEKGLIDMFAPVSDDDPRDQGRGDQRLEDLSKPGPGAMGYHCGDSVHGMLLVGWLTG